MKQEPQFNLTDRVVHKHSGSYRDKTAVVIDRWKSHSRFGTSWDYEILYKDGQRFGCNESVLEARRNDL